MSHGGTTNIYHKAEEASMRIAVVVHNNVKRDARVLKGATSLKSLGHDVRLFGLTANDSEHFILPNGVPVHLKHRDLSGIRSRMAEEELPPGKESSIWTSFRTQGDLLFESVKEVFEPDLVHLHDHLSFTAAEKYKDHFRCPIVWDAHEIYEDMASIAPERARVNSRIIRENVVFADGFITLNESISSFYREKYPELPEAVLAPNAVEYTTPPVYDGRLHKAAGLRHEQKILLFQGGLAPHRGIAALLEASNHLDEDWSVVFMGWGALESQIVEFAGDNNDRASDRARVAVIPGAPHHELLSWTSGATLGAIPYENTGLNHLYCSPNKLWEYPAAGVPILVTDLPEMRKRVENYEIGIAVPRELDPIQIAESIHSLTDSRLGEMRLNCSHFSTVENWQTYEAQISRLFEELIEANNANNLDSVPNVDAGPQFGSLWKRITSFFAGR